MEEMRDEMDGEEREEEDETGTEEMTACTECIYFIPITRCREKKKSMQYTKSGKKHSINFMNMLM